MAIIVLLGAIRAATDAAFTFASLALLPVLLIAWVGGRAHGVFVAFLAALMWAIGDFVAERQFSAPWIPWANTATRFLTYALVAVLAAQVRVLLQREREHATLDSLTGLKNRRAFLEAGASELDRLRRYRRPVAIIFLDLDDFKAINDTKGHDVGDSALRAAANALSATLRGSDLVGRLGGDEFAVLLPEIGYEEAIAAGLKTSEALNASLRDYPPVQNSTGIAWFEEVDHDLAAMLEEADKLMYLAKADRNHGIRASRFAKSHNHLR
ncbi:MAG: GGDEF domain-containing protein [Usitatibacteraceae bacterium]